MGCRFPIKAYRPRFGTRLVFDVKAGWEDRPVFLPCNHCVGCRLEYSRQWAMRCMHEARCSDESAFVTLTYEDGKVPYGGSLVKAELSAFCKRLHNRLLRSRGRGIRYYGAGEYGDKTARPHYHVLVFGHVFKDRRVWRRETATQSALYSSAELSSLWPDGFSLFGDVTFDSAAYTARYCMKKVTGPDAWQAYQKIDPSTGEIFQLEPEGAVMSKGIGREWFERYGCHAYALDEVIVNGRPAKPPRYYDGKFEIIDTRAYNLVKAKRRSAARLKVADDTPERRRVKEVVLEAKLKLGARSL